MSDKNGYFQLTIKGENVFVHIYPAVGQGQTLTVSELSEYLSFKGYTYNLTELNEAVKSKNEEEVLVKSDIVCQESEMMKLMVSDGAMKAYARFYPPSAGGPLMSAEDINQELKLKKITVGIKDDAIQQYVKNRQYCTDILIAEGIPMREGHDGRIEYLFDTELDTKPKMNDDGTVDFFHLNTVCHCTKGQELARMIKEDAGTPGQSVKGDTISPHDVKKVTLQYGRNILLSEDRTTLISEIDGHVILVGDKVFVSGVLELQDVDTSTGNIEYDGDVLVQGNVMTGFSIKTNGNIEVKGVVEGAELHAGGNIVIARGVNGMARGKLVAGGNIIAKYMENANVTAGRNVEAEAILHSQVSARVQVTVQGKKGFITGGTVRAGEAVEAKTLGSSMGVDTVIEVGTDPEQKERFAFLQKRIAETKKSIASIEPVLVAVGKKLGSGEKLPVEQIKRMQVLSKNLLAQKEQLKTDTVELTSLSVSFDRETESVVRVLGEAYPGTHIVISESSLVLREKYHYCRFIREGGDVVMAGL